MSKFEIKTRTLNLVDALWWKFVPGTVVTVKWPTGIIIAGPGTDDPLWYDLGGSAYVKFESADPNDHYRPWLEKNVGKQGWDWQWRSGSTGLYSNGDMADSVYIKLRKKHEYLASAIALKWK